MAKTTRRAPARRSSPSSKKKGKARTPTRQILSPWVRDAIGIGLVVFGLLSVLSVWFSRWLICSTDSEDAVTKTPLAERTEASGNPQRP